MSFILKALKKLESEKVERKAAPVEIDSAILAPDRNSFSSPRKRGKGIWIVILLALIAGAGLIFIYPHKTPPPATETVKMTTQPAPTVQAAPIAQAVQPQAEKTEQPGARINTPAGPQVPLGQNEPETRPKRVYQKNDVASPSEPEHRASFVAATPGLTVSGIALQDDPAESMAVVNGGLVKTGATVGGAVVDRIYLDRVRFKGNGGTFEVYLSK